MPDTLLLQLQQLRQLFSEAAPEDQKTVSDYAWTIVKVLLQHVTDIDALTARQLLADCMKLPHERPSKLHSAMLSAAVKVEAAYPEFRFAAFLRMWGIANLRSEDNERQQASDGKSFPSLAERTAKALGHSLLLHPEDSLSASGSEGLESLLSTYGYSLHPMLVTRIKDATGKDGRKYHFVTLTSAEGLEVETTTHALQLSPLHPLPEGKRHFVNIGQLYECLLRSKPASAGASVQASAVQAAYLSTRQPTDCFPLECGYVEAIDAAHGLIHIFDRHSRHFVAHVLRFSKERAGDFVRFIPIIPQTSKFKTAVITGRIQEPVLPLLEQGPQPSIVRTVRITFINQQRHFASWTLVDESHPITEQLSPLQIAQGETSPSFTQGYLSLDEQNRLPQDMAPIAASSALAIGQELHAVVYLRRGKDGQKHPRIARIL